MLKSTLWTKFSKFSKDGPEIVTGPASTPVNAGVEPLHIPLAAIPAYGMQLVPPAATGTYCLKIPKLVALRLGSAEIAAKPAVVGVATPPALVPVSPIG